MLEFKCAKHTYDVLHSDRVTGKPFHALRLNRLGSADPAMCHCPQVYKDLSPMDNISSVKTAVMLVETGAERQAGNDPARIFFNAL